MIEEVAVKHLAQLEAGNYRWKISRGNPFGLLELNLQRKGWFFWHDVARGTRYPEYHDERRYTSTEEYRDRIEAYKRHTIVSVTRSQEANRADAQFFS